MIWSLLVGAFIGWIGSLLRKYFSNNMPQFIANILAGLIGSAVGQSLFGHWGPRLAGMAVIPSVLGSVIVIAVVSFFFGKKE